MGDTYPQADLTHRIIGAFFGVYNALGVGLRESAYHRAMVRALEIEGLIVASEVTLDIRFRDERVGDCRADLVVADRVLVELKAIPKILPAHSTQTLNLLRATQLEVGLLLNFGPRPQIKRLVLTRPRSA